jgi:hypothetical protein
VCLKALIPRLAAGQSILPDFHIDHKRPITNIKTTMNKMLKNIPPIAFHTGG